MKPSKWPEKETDLAGVVVNWLLGHGWEVYQEVQAWQGGPIADIVAVLNGKYWVVECKKTLGFRVIDQAIAWSYYAHYASVAVPVKKNHIYYKSNIDSEVLRWKGLGLLICSKPSDHYEGCFIDGVYSSKKTGIDITRSVHELMRPKLMRKALSHYLRDVLTEDHKTFCAAGSSGGGHYTPFKATCREIIKAVSNKPGITMKELLNTIDTHYQTTATARSCIFNYLRKGIIKGIRLDESKRPARLYTDSK